MAKSSYSNLKVDKDAIKDSIFEHPEFVTFSTQMDDLFKEWKLESTIALKNLIPGFNPKETISHLSENLLAHYTDKALIDKYDMYQHLMTYWFAVMQDDCYLITQDGWKAETYRIIVESGKAKKKVDKGWACDLIPKELVINRYFKAEKVVLEKLHAEKETLAAELTELEEEHSGEEGVFAEMDKVNKGSVTARIKELKEEEKSNSAGISTERSRSTAENVASSRSEDSMAAEPETAYGAEDELKILKKYIDLSNQQTATNKKIKEAETTLDDTVYAKYLTLTEAEIKQLVVDDKWMENIETTIQEEINHISQHLTNRIKELAERYTETLAEIDARLEEIEDKVNEHLHKMGFVWN